MRIALAMVALCGLAGIARVSAMQTIAVQVPQGPRVGVVAPAPPTPPAKVSSSGTEINLEGTWKFQVDLTGGGNDKGWASPDFDDSKWRDINVPGDWESQGVKQVNPAWSQSDDLHQPYTGYAWYRKKVIIPAEWKGKTLILQLGEIDDLDWTRVNGRWVGETSDRSNWPSAKPRSYTIPSEIVRWGKPNVITVRVLDYRGLGGMRSGPVKITTADTTGSPAPTTPDNDAVKIGGGVTIQPGQTVKSAVAIGGSLRVYGHVTQDAVSVGGTVHVYPGGVIDGDAVAVGGQVVQESGATIRGSNESIGGLPLEFTWPWERYAPLHSPFDAMIVGAAIGFGKRILLTLLSLVIVALFLTRTEIVARSIIDRPGWSILYGVIAVLLAIPVALFLLVTCIGIPLILVEVAVLILARFLGFAGLALAIGWRLGDGFHKPIASPLIAVLIGGLTLAIIGLVPFLGGAVDWILKLFGFGAVFLTGFGTSADWIWNRKGTAPISQPPAQ